MSDHYDTMQVCKNWGHKITDYYDDLPNHRQEYCDKCGGETVISCEYCKERIRGFYHVDGVIGGPSPEVPLHCHKCGKPYSWRTKRFIINSAKTLVSPIKYIFDSIIGIFKK